MNYSDLLTRAWHIIWNNKFMIFLGILVVLGGGSGGRFSSSGRFNLPGRNGPFQGVTPPGPTFRNFINQLGDHASMAYAIIGAAVCIVLGIVLVLAFLARIADGGLIFSANTVEGGAAVTLSQSWNAAWGKMVTLVSIGVVGALPGLILLIIYVAAFFALGGVGMVRDWIANGSGFSDPSIFVRRFMPMVLTFVALACLAISIAIVMRLMVTLADRAAMLENKDMVESFRHGWAVLTEHFSQVVLVGLIQIAVSIGVGILLAIPLFILSLCCFLWPVVWVIDGLVQSYFSTLWTLAWRQWTQMSPVEAAQSPSGSNS